MRPPRVAFFTDSFHEINGVAHTSRNFVAYAERHHLPFLSVRAGSAPALLTGPVHSLELPRSRAAISLEKDLHFDPLFFRHTRRIDRALRAFQPDVLHITGPSELGIFGAWFAWRHRIPLAASWHTNIHEYAGRRMNWLTRHLSPARAAALEGTVERLTLDASTRFYRLARVLFAPNPELCNLLEHRCRRPCHLMQRGVDTVLFSPVHRTRPAHGEAAAETPSSSSTPSPDPVLEELRALPPTTLVLGFVGRLSIEKNVGLLPRLQAGLRELGILNTRFLIVGHGSLESELRSALPDALFPGILRGASLAQAYANLDLLVFPSHTDTFGNVVLEALASGVPALVTPSGGPRHIVREQPEEARTGYVLPDDGFVPALARLARDPAALARMRAAARAYALTCSWNAVFDQVYAAYQPLLEPARNPA